jgi:hypothetical protein
MRSLAALPLLMGLVAPHAAASPSPPAAPPRAGLRDAVAVLHDWDARRAAAWSTHDAGALRALYEPGSGAGAADLRLLRDYEGHGIVVRRLVTQVFAVQVVRRNSTTLVLRVADRVAGGEVVETGVAAPLPSSPPALRTVELRRTSGTWRVAAVSGSGRAPRAARR